MPAMPALPPVQDPVARPGWRGEERPRADWHRAERGPRREALQTAPPSLPAPPPVAQPRPAPPMPAPSARPPQEARTAERPNPPRERNHERGNPGRNSRLQPEAER